MEQQMKNSQFDRAMKAIRQEMRWKLAVPAALVVVGLCLVVPGSVNIAKKGMAVSAVQDKVDVLVVAVQKDVDVVMACNTADGAKTADFQLTDKWRTCMMTAMPRMKTTTGATIALSVAGSWLDQNPQDAEFRALSNTVIDKAWVALESESEIYKAMDDLQSAMAQQPVLRMVQAARGETTRRSSIGDSMMEQLDRAELRVNAMDLLRKQAKRRIEFGTQKTV